MKTFVRSPLIRTFQVVSDETPVGFPGTVASSSCPGRNEDLMDDMYETRSRTASAAIEAKWRDRLQALGRTWGKFDRR